MTRLTIDNQYPPLDNHVKKNVEYFFMSTDDKEPPTLDRLDSLIATVNQIASDVRGLTERLDRLEAKVDVRLQETRPIWEAIQTQLEELRTETQRGFRRLDQVFNKVAGSLTRVEVVQADIEGRIDKLEEKAS